MIGCGSSVKSGYLGRYVQVNKQAVVQTADPNREIEESTFECRYTYLCVCDRNVGR